MLPFKSMIKLEAQNKMPLYLQITNGIIKQILKGRIAPGHRMPGTRNLAEQMQVHRNTVIASYEELEAQGWLQVIPAKGSFVIEKLPLVKAQKWTRTSKLKQPLAQSSFELNASSKRDLGLLKTNHYPLGFDDGCPDVRIAPIQALGRHYKSLLMSQSKQKFDYSWDVKGNIHLRKAIKKYLSSSRGINVSEENILITRGSLMGFYLLFKNLLKPGDRVVVGEMSYHPVNQMIKDFGGILEPVPVDENGLDMDVVEQLCKEKKIKALYVSPHHHHPTTVTLSCNRRMQLLHLAAQFNLAIIEDDYDFDFHYKSSPILPLMSSDDHGQVVYTGSFSKSLAPAFRLGYIVASENVIEAMAYSRRYIDRQGDELLERALAMMMEEGELKRHLRKALVIYKSRRDHFCHLLDTYLANKIQFKKPEGGLTVWGKFDASIDLVKVVEKAKKKGLFMVNPKVYSPSDEILNATRLGFASMNEDEISKAVKLLKSVL